MKQNLNQLAPVTDQVTTSKKSLLETVRDRRGEVSFFSPALLLTAGRLPVDPLNEFVTRCSIAESARPFCVEVRPPTGPFFSGLGSSVFLNELIDWDRRLYAVPNASAEACFNFLGCIGITGDNFLASSVKYVIDIPDPTMPQFVQNQHNISVTLFGVLHDDKITYLEPRGFFPPVVKTIAASAALEGSNCFHPGFDLSQLAEIKEQL